MNKKSVSVSNYIKVFFISFISMLLILLPNMIQNHGVFMYTGDYTFQQIPFYYHASVRIKNTLLGWDWFTDLGADFLTSYSYYLTGSIFFWMISWLSGMKIVYAMPVMIAFKTSVGALGAYVYIHNYVKDENATFIGAYMYAFSGFQMASLIFNTFHDITALFPFFLLSFDLLVKENKKVFFAVMTGLVALTNYFFFFGMFIFTLLYYIIKCIRMDFLFSTKKLLFIVIESVIGVGTAAVILVPTFLLLSSNNRVSDILYGVNLVSYSDNTIIPKIFQSMFLIPDPLSGGMLFKSKDNPNNWASISLYLPLFTVTGVTVFLKNKKANWISTILKCCLVIALVPGLNGMFSLFNSSYYARWYYMPILMMCLATSYVLEENYDLKYGIKTASLGLVILALVFFLPNKVAKESDKLSIALRKTDSIETEIKLCSISSAPLLFWQCMAFSIVFLIILYVYEHEKSKFTNGLKKISSIMVILTVITFNIFIGSTINQTEFDSEDCYKSFIGFTPEFNDDGKYRITHATTNSINNFSMLWGYMNAGCFHSIEPDESDDFYDEIKGYSRNMMSKYEQEDYPAYSLLSVKYILNRSTGDDLNVEVLPVKLTGCSLYDKQECYYIYINDCFIPFGFMYDYCIDDSTLTEYIDMNIEKNQYQYKKLAMLRALILDKEDIEKYSDYIKVLPENMLDSLDENTYTLDCAERRAESCSYFDYDAKGFSAEIKTDKAGLVFFSVPCSEGWSAKVNGQNKEIIKAHYGLTAVAVEQGDNKIEFSYTTPGLKEGVLISAVSVIALFIYWIMTLVYNRNKNNRSKLGDSLRTN